MSNNTYRTNIHESFVYSIEINEFEFVYGYSIDFYFDSDSDNDNYSDSDSVDNTRVIDHDNPHDGTSYNKLFINNNKISDKCSICISDMELDEELISLSCGHIYHSPCISEWVKFKSKCPICRGNIKIC